jgi:hypothetical protein
MRKETLISGLNAIQPIPIFITGEKSFENFKDGLEKSLIPYTETFENFENEWAETIKVEKTRIEAEQAEKARIEAEQAEAERRASEEISQQNQNQNFPAPPAQNGGGTYDPYARLMAVIASTGLTGPSYSIGHTGCLMFERVLGCYFGGRIEVTPFAMNGYNDCQLRTVVAHEWRHWWQEQNALFDNGAPWLEADADAFSASYGCGV